MPTLRFSACSLVLAISCGGAAAQSGQSARGSSSRNDSAAKTAAADYQRGITAMQLGDLATAHAAFEKAVQANPQSADAQNMLGQVLLKQGHVDEAIGRFRTLVQLKP